MCRLCGGGTGIFCGSSGSKLDIRIPRCPLGAPDCYITSRIIAGKAVTNGYIDQSANSEKSCVNFPLSFKALLIASIICTMLYVI